MNESAVRHDEDDVIRWHIDTLYSLHYSHAVLKSLRDERQYTARYNSLYWSGKRSQIAIGFWRFIMPKAKVLLAWAKPFGRIYNA